MTQSEGRDLVSEEASARAAIKKLLEDHDSPGALRVLSKAAFDHAYAMQDAAECDDEPESAERKDRHAAALFAISADLQKLSERVKRKPR